MNYQSREPGRATDGPAEADLGDLTLSPTEHSLLNGLECEGMKFSVSLPPGFDCKERWPAILFLHGSMESGVDGVAQTRVGIGPALLAAPKDYPAVVIMPQLSDYEDGWSPERLKSVLAVLDRAINDYRVDPQAVSLTGVSMGGMGVFELGNIAPERFSSILSICGYWDRRPFSEGLKNVPVRLFHGDADELVSVRESQRIVEALRGLGNATAELTELPGVGHVAWDQVYADPKIAGWLTTPKS